MVFWNSIAQFTCKPSKDHFKQKFFWSWTWIHSLLNVLNDSKKHMVVYKQTVGPMFIPSPAFVYFTSQSCRLLFQTIIFLPRITPETKTFQSSMPKQLCRNERPLYGKSWFAAFVRIRALHTITIGKQRWRYGCKKFLRSWWSSDAT